MSPIIEGYRGLAALVVMAHHYVYLLPESALPFAPARIHFFHNGVDMYFVITGFLFAPYVLNESDMRPGAFLVRRAFRLYPLFLMSLAGYAWLMWTQKTALVPALAKHALFIQTLPGSAPGEVNYFSLVFWTLPVEVHFYLLLAALLVLRHTLRASPNAAKWSGLRLGAIGAFCALLWYAIFRIGHDSTSFAWMLRQAQLPALLIEFWFGIALYRLLPALKRAGGTANLAVLAGAMMLLGLLSSIYAGMQQEIALTPRPFGPFNVLSALAFALLLGSSMALNERISMPRALQDVFLWCGRLSYALYLFHELILLYVTQTFASLPPGQRIAIAVVATFAAAQLLHHGAERPLRQYGRKISARVAAAAT